MQQSKTDTVQQTYFIFIEFVSNVVMKTYSEAALAVKEEGCLNRRRNRIKLLR